MEDEPTELGFDYYWVALQWRREVFKLFAHPRFWGVALLSLGLIRLHPRRRWPSKPQTPIQQLRRQAKDFHDRRVYRSDEVAINVNVLRAGSPVKLESTTLFGGSSYKLRHRRRSDHLRRPCQPRDKAIPFPLSLFPFLSLCPERDAAVEAPEIWREIG